MSVRAVCRRSKLTERYFYENFADRDELIVAVYEGVVTDAHRALVEAVDTAGRDAEARAEAAVTAFVTLILDDPRKGRVLLLAPLADPALNRRGTERIPMFAELVRSQLSGSSREVDEGDRAMTATALVGGLANLFTAYLGGSLDVSRERLTAHCVRLVLGANALHS